MAIMKGRLVCLQFVVAMLKDHGFTVYTANGTEQRRLLVLERLVGDVG